MQVSITQYTAYGLVALLHHYQHYYYYTHTYIISCINIPIFRQGRNL